MEGEGREEGSGQYLTRAQVDGHGGEGLAGQAAQALPHYAADLGGRVRREDLQLRPPSLQPHSAL